MTFTLIPAASTFTPSVQVSGFDDISRLTRCDRLVCDFCSSGQCFACGFLQIPPRDGHPCRPASGSPYRAHRGLAPPSHPASPTCTGTAPVKALRAMPGALKKKGQMNVSSGPFFIRLHRLLHERGAYSSTSEKNASSGRPASTRASISVYTMVGEPLAWTSTFFQSIPDASTARTSWS